MFPVYKREDALPSKFLSVNEYSNLRERGQGTSLPFSLNKKIVW